MILLTLSLLNLTYLIRHKTLLSEGENKLEIFDEVCITICAYLSTMLLNIGMDGQVKNNIGYLYFGFASSSILFNLAIALYTSITGFVGSARSNLYYKRANIAFRKKLGLRDEICEILPEDKAV